MSRHTLGHVRPEHTLRYLEELEELQEEEVPMHTLVERVRRMFPPVDPDTQARWERAHARAHAPARDAGPTGGEEGGPGPT